jgi:hypothetical protein
MPLATNGQWQAVNGSLSIFERLQIPAAKLFRSGSFGSRSGGFGGRSRSFGSRSRSFGSRSRSFGSRGRSFGSRGRSFGSRGRSFGSRGRSFGSRSRSFGSRSRSLGSRSGGFGSRGRSLGSRGHFFFSGRNRLFRHFRCGHFVRGLHVRSLLGRLLVHRSNIRPQAIGLRSVCSRRRRRTTGHYDHCSDQRCPERH